MPLRVNVQVEKDRFLSVACEDRERIVLDRKEGRYHLLRESAARLWEQIEKGGTFRVETSLAEGEDDPVDLLRQAGLLEFATESSPAVPRISRRAWIGGTGKLAAGTAMLPLVASLAAQPMGTCPGDRVSGAREWNLASTIAEGTFHSAGFFARKGGFS